MTPPEPNIPETNYRRNGDLIRVSLSEYGINHHNLPKVSDTDRLRLKSYELRAGDIVFSRVGSVDRNALIGKEEHGWLFSGRLLRIRILDRAINPIYLSYHFHSHPFTRRILSVAVGQTMASLNTQILRDVFIVVPPPTEQRAIAEALSDVDGLLESLDSLIEKKRAIKKTAMQQLLTGETRLPDFSGTWETKPLGKIASLQRGFDLPNARIRPGPFSVVYSNGVLRHHERAMVKGPGVVTGRSGTIGKVHFIEEDYWPHNTTLWVTAFHESDPKYIYYLYAHINLERFLSGSGVPTLNRNDVHAHLVTCPPFPEQCAIATALSDIDTEIAALKARRDKTRAIKQGMMQQLLNGRVRLI